MSLPFFIQYLPVENISALAADKNVLAAIRFASVASVENTTKPLFSVGLPNLALSNVVEVWYSDTPIQTTVVNGIQLSWNDDILFGHILLDEAKYRNLVAATEDTYRLIVNLLKKKGYPCLLRLWNYLPSVSQSPQNLQNYQAFCQGRQQILDAVGHWESTPPASTTIGASCSGLQIYFIATKQPAKALENPRQASDFLYPPQYGSVHATFARAVIKKWTDSSHLYISATPSVVGYEKRHLGQVKRQLDEVLNNIEALLLAQTLDGQPLPIKSFTELSFLKVYLCDLFMLSVTEEYLIRRYGSQLPPVLFLRGDVLETGLLIEIEAIYIQSDA
jgi:chorismate lyase/3-hydroxybenzoate synthase